MTAILLHFTLQRGLIICPAVFFHQGIWTTAQRMVVDTAASYTLVAPDILEGLGIDHWSTFETTEAASVTGKGRFPKATLDQIGVKEVSAHNVEVQVGSLPEELGVQGLLGYSFLQHFKIVTINYEAQELTLIPK